MNDCPKFRTLATVCNMLIPKLLSGQCSVGQAGNY